MQCSKSLYSIDILYTTLKFVRSRRTNLIVQPRWQRKISKQVGAAAALKPIPYSDQHLSGSVQHHSNITLGSAGIHKLGAGGY